jgi:diguanylate cyclase (GGDEF)-like protein/PAS domain S-box-containing protein
VRATPDKPKARDDRDVAAASLSDRLRQFAVGGWQSHAIILGIATACAVMCLFLWSQVNWINDITAGERRELQLQLDQMQRGYSAEFDDLYSAVGDYAIWSETAEFIRGNRPNYFGTALDAGSLARLEVDEFLLLSLDGRVRLSVAILGGKASALAPDPRLLQTVRDSAEQGELRSVNSSAQGLLSLDRGTILFVARPVFDNDAAGSPAGYIVFSRRLSDSTSQRIAQYATWPVQGFTVNKGQLSSGLTPDIASWARQSDPPEDARIDLGHEEAAQGYLRIRDVNGKLGWLLRVEMKRTARAEAQSTALVQRLIMIGACVLFAVLLVLWIRNWRRIDFDRAAMEMRYRAIIEQADEGMLIVHGDTLLIQEANPAFQRLVGMNLDHLHGMTISDLLADMPDGEPGGLEATLRGISRRGLELGLATSNGDMRPVEVSCSDVELSDHHLLALVVRDLSVRKKAESQLIAKQKHLDKLAHHDQLTGLPNRLYLQAHLPEAIAKAGEQKRMLAVLFLDLDRFKHINDSRGHEVGDKLLQEIAKRVRTAVRPDDVVVRMGGDEFVVVLHGARTHDEINAAAARINEVLAAPVVIDGRAVVATVSIGVSVFPRDGASMTELLKHSDTAMYQAKDRGRNNFQMFSPLMDQKIKERVAIEANLRAGLKLNQFDVHYQPILDITTRRVAGMEALLRWKHPSHGYISPARFIDVAEDTGLIVPLGHFVLHRVAQDLARWRDQGLKLTPVAINISAVQLERTNLRDLIQRALTQYKLGPEWLQLELTEGSLFEKRTGESREDVLGQLRELGVKIAIDDFGTGYSSLSYLKRWRVDTLKIDRGFIRDIATDHSDHAIVGAIIAMARNLNIKVVAEGIEGWQQLELLRNMGCHLAQGFLFAKPAPAAEAERFLQTLQVDILAEANQPQSLAETGT